MQINSKLYIPNKYVVEAWDNGNGGTFIFKKSQ